MNQPKSRTTPLDFEDTLALTTSDAAGVHPLSTNPQNSADDAKLYRSLSKIISKIYESNNIEESIAAISNNLCALLGAERFTFYISDISRPIIVSTIKTGLNTKSEIRLPISPRSIAGFAAKSHLILNIADVYDTVALKNIHPDLSFLKAVDNMSGFKTKEMLCVPILDNDHLLGVLQFINNMNGGAFSTAIVDGVSELSKALSKAMRLRNFDDQTKFHAKKYAPLVINEIVSNDELQEAIELAKEKSSSIESILINNFELKPHQIGQSLAKFFNVPYVVHDPNRIRIELIHGAFKKDYLLEQGWIPIEETENGLLIMCLDPEQTRASGVIKQVFKNFKKIDYRVTTQCEFDATLIQLFDHQQNIQDFDTMLADLDTSSAPLESDSERILEQEASDNELVKFVNKIIMDAYAQGASDIHIEPMLGKMKTGVRLRIDGSLTPYIEVPAHLRQAMVTRIKIMCDLDIAERRKPQDGKIKFKKYGPLDIELRVATIPTSGGVEDVVMRILAAGEPVPIEKLNLSDVNLEKIKTVISKPYGLFYVCGPTGSGKTTTLHSLLKFLNKNDTKIWTAEDPVEITQKGLRQVQINKKAGIDFALIMRAFLRADPDVIMVGESRDKETVSMGVEASLTGHLVFSTLHTNSAPESITRLIDMGMDPFNFADALLGILAQRLTKRLCDCKQPYQPSEAELQAFIHEYSSELRETSNWKTDPEEVQQRLLLSWQQQYGNDGHLVFYHANGCKKCNNTGYKGRLGLHELLINSDNIKHLIQTRSLVSAIFSASLEEGMTTLKMDGMLKVLQGLTDLKMVRQVCIK